MPDPKQHLDLSLYSDHLESVSDNLWVGSSTAPISYPEGDLDVLAKIEDHSFWFRHRNKCILAAIKNFPPQGMIFDIGGGNGFVSQGLNHHGYNAVVVEPDNGGVQTCLKRNIQTIHSSLIDAAFKSETIPAAGMFDVLEHLEDDDQALTEIFRILSPQGKLYLTVPAYQFLWSHDDVQAGHYRRYTKKSITRILEGHGYHICHINYFFSPLLFVILFLKSLPDHFRKINEEESLEDTAKKHGANNSRIGDALLKVLGFEVTFIKKNLLIPFGSSLLVIAEKPAN